jgi:ABC-type uncharacterized transport system substrate-binding protein
MPTLKTLISACALCLLAPLPVVAHPHIFIDAGVALVFDGSGKLAAIRVTWAYDALYSLLLIEEKGLDQDGDGLPEEDKLAAFAGKDVDWAGGFPGDLYATVNETDLALLKPQQHEARFQDDRYMTSHLRPLAQPVAPEVGPISVRVYDPTYFVAYDIRLPLTVEGREDCSITRVPADLARAYDRVEEILYGPESAKYVGDDTYPEVGDLFADELKLSCVSG